ncbi:RH39, partial [Symbiodinium pilosum]
GTLAELVALIYGERQRGIKQRLPDLTVAKLLKMRKFAEELHSRGLLGEKAEDEIRKLGEHRISQFEFCCFLLVQNDIISMDDVEVISKNFLQLDLSGDGALWTKDALAWELKRLLQPKTKKGAIGKDVPDKKNEDISKAEAEKLQNSLDAIDMKTAGCIELSELEKALVKVGVDASGDYVKKFFLELDLNGDGKISFQEYKALIRKLCRTRSAPADSLDPEAENFEKDLSVSQGYKSEASIGTEKASKKYGQGSPGLRFNWTCAVTVNHAQGISAFDGEDMDGGFEILGKADRTQSAEGELLGYLTTPVLEEGSPTGGRAKKRQDKAAVSTSQDMPSGDGLADIRERLLASDSESDQEGQDSESDAEDAGEEGQDAGARPAQAPFSWSQLAEGDDAAQLGPLPARQLERAGGGDRIQAATFGGRYTDQDRLPGSRRIARRKALGVRTKNRLDAGRNYASPDDDLLL